MIRCFHCNVWSFIMLFYKSAKTVCLSCWNTNETSNRWTQQKPTQNTTHTKLKSYCERTKKVIIFSRACWVCAVTLNKIYRKKYTHFNKAIESILVIFPWVFFLLFRWTYSMLFTWKQMFFFYLYARQEKCTNERDRNGVLLFNNSIQAKVSSLPTLSAKLCLCLVFYSIKNYINTRKHSMDSEFLSDFWLYETLKRHAWVAI